MSPEVLSGIAILCLVLFTIPLLVLVLKGQQVRQRLPAWLGLLAITFGLGILSLVLGIAAFIGLATA